MLLIVEYYPIVFHVNMLQGIIPPPFGIVHHNPFVWIKLTQELNQISNGVNVSIFHDFPFSKSQSFFFPSLVQGIYPLDSFANGKHHAPNLHSADNGPPLFYQKTKPIPSYCTPNSDCVCRQKEKV